jgi:hypothetical protein
MQHIISHTIQISNTWIYVHITNSHKSKYISSETSVLMRFKYRVLVAAVAEASACGGHEPQPRRQRRRVLAAIERRRGASGVCPVAPSEEGASARSGGAACECVFGGGGVEGMRACERR